MPAAVDAPPLPEPSPLTLRPEHTAEADALDALEPPRRHGRGWRSLLVAGLIGAVIGAAIPGGLQLAERAAADADEERLRAVATDYLVAIAEGRAEDATGMVPLPEGRDASPDAVLQAAVGRLEAPEVRLVTIDGDLATVEVRYEVDASDHARTLEAERTGGTWRLTTPLVEQVRVHQAVPGTTSIAGVSVGSTMPNTAGAWLYPGEYRLDERGPAVLRMTSEPFTIDGDPATVSETFLDAQLAPQHQAQVFERALAVARQCQAGTECTIPADAELAADHTFIRSLSERGVDISVLLSTAPVLVDQGTPTQGWTTHGVEVVVRLELDEAGELAGWLCAPVGGYGTPSEPCPATPDAG